MRYHEYKSLSHLSSCGLKNEVKVTKTYSALKLVPMIYPGKFGEILSTGSRDIVGTRIYHAVSHADANGIHTETNMSLLTFGKAT